MAHISRIFEQLGFIQFTNENTRMSSVSQTKIDLLFSNKVFSIHSTDVIEKYFSYHCLISATITEIKAQSNYVLGISCLLKI